MFVCVYTQIILLLPQSALHVKVYSWPERDLLTPSPGSKSTSWTALLLSRLLPFLNSNPKKLEAGDGEGRVRL